MCVGCVCMCVLYMHVVCVYVCVCLCASYILLSPSPHTAEIVSQVLLCLTHGEASKWVLRVTDLAPLPSSMSSSICSQGSLGQNSVCFAFCCSHYPSHLPSSR